MSARGNTWQCPAGEAQTYTVTITNSAGIALTNLYDGSEALEALVWQGSNLAPIAGVLAPAWNTPADGTVNVALTVPDDMAPGWYRVRLSVTYTGQKSPFYYGWLEVLATPDAGEEPPTYTSYQDLEDLAGDWLKRLMQGDQTDRSNFLAERAMAREWLDDIIIGNSRVFAYRFDLNYALYYGSFPFGPVEAPDTVIAQYLASNYLMVVPRTIECCAYKALAFICEKRMTFDEDGESYRRRAIFYHRKASNSLRRYRATLDTNADGKPDIAFNLGVITFR